MVLSHREHAGRLTKASSHRTTYLSLARFLIRGVYAALACNIQKLRRTVCTSQADSRCMDELSSPILVMLEYVGLLRMCRYMCMDPANLNSGAPRTGEVNPSMLTTLLTDTTTYLQSIVCCMQCCKAYIYTPMHFHHVTNQQQTTASL